MDHHSQGKPTSTRDEVDLEDLSNAEISMAAAFFRIAQEQPAAEARLLEQGIEEKRQQIAELEKEIAADKFVADICRQEANEARLQVEALEQEQKARLQALIVGPRA